MSDLTLPQPFTNVAITMCASYEVIDIKTDNNKKVLNYKFKIFGMPKIQDPLQTASITNYLLQKQGVQ